MAEVIDCAADSRRLRKLHGLKMADLRTSVTTLIEDGENPLLRHPLGAAFEGTEINCVSFGYKRQAPLSLCRYDDVSLVGNGQMFTLFRGNEIDQESTALFLGFPDLTPEGITHIETGAYCDDRFRPGNPCHFMVDRLPRVTFYTALAGLAQKDCVMFGEMPPYAAYVQRHCAPDVTILAENRHYHFRTLYLFNTCANPQGHPFFYMNQMARDAVIPAVTTDLPAGPKGRRIYMSRFATERRRLLNERALADRLAARGFEILEMSALAPEAQLAAVREAECIVAPHGAALASVVAATPGTKVVELFNPLKGTAVYGGMAGAVGAPYTPVFGTPVADAKKPFSWTVDIDAVLAAIDGPATLG
ncbi:glycosyltransferase family 61 protein [Acuticoccus sp. MNP-M23]|uniref:glycosyltransferase family 61 protein n=1 Tax=Acuticoccus sp. MNP-M23 TaxID=3072793 RepID=UPI0028153609|nr:glycosyltransferase family 61 protein [Acuticoccus sp. MNP-M23]WMS42217.1 glycosyltransferase family 61 protein [Acuticoccus sp. MNP-M23]